MKTLKIESLTFVRAGSDYKPGFWTANVAADPRIELGADYRIQRRDGTHYVIRAARYEIMNGRQTVLFYDVPEYGVPNDK